MKTHPFTICCEHGEDIYYSGSYEYNPTRTDCPACRQIEELQKQHAEEIDRAERNVELLDGKEIYNGGNKW